MNSTCPKKVSFTGLLPVSYNLFYNSLGSNQRQIFQSGKEILALERQGAMAVAVGEFWWIFHTFNFFFFYLFISLALHTTLTLPLPINLLRIRKNSDKSDFAKSMTQIQYIL